MNVIDANCIHERHLRTVLQRDAVAIRVKGFTERSVCDELSARVLTSRLYGAYANAPRIGRIGRAFFETTVSNAALTDYFEHSVEWIEELRAACAPSLT